MLYTGLIDLMIKINDETEAGIYLIDRFEAAMKSRKFYTGLSENYLLSEGGLIAATLEALRLSEYQDHIRNIILTSAPEDVRERIFTDFDATLFATNLPEISDLINADFIEKLKHIYEELPTYEEAMGDIFAERQETDFLRPPPPTRTPPAIPIAARLNLRSSEAPVLAESAAAINPGRAPSDTQARRQPTRTGSKTCGIS